ncbi:hypothetical protein [Roseateles sp. MS654]|uniref:hypothetical protein n=1 Tax=Roseateles sp. MS654 TaxID=3412685 RepID=UPI003C2E8DB2
MHKFLQWAATFALSAAGTHAMAQDAPPAPRLIPAPDMHVRQVDSERLVVRRIDVVDDTGVIRAILAGNMPPPIDGVTYKRAFPAAGVLLFDRNGSERGGFGVADVPGSIVSLAQDHYNGDAVGWRTMPDGSVAFVMNERAPITKDVKTGRIANQYGAQRLQMTVGADGTPAINVQDKESRPRLRLTLTPEGFGAIEFLDAAGKVVETLAPERDRMRK